MSYQSHLSIEKLYDVYTEIHESFDSARLSLDELQMEITDELSEFTTSLDDIREELERSTNMMRRLSRRMGPAFSLFMEEEDNEIPFLTDNE